MNRTSNEELPTQSTEAPTFGRTAAAESKEPRAAGTIESPQLAADRARLQREEQARIDDERQAELARQRELARFD